jgi:hypothetical protein
MLITLPLIILNNQKQLVQKEEKNGQHSTFYISNHNWNIDLIATIIAYPCTNVTLPS